MKTSTPTTTFHKKGDNNMSHTSPIVSWRRLTGLAGAAAVIVALVTSAAPAVAATKAAAFSKPSVTLSPASATGLDDVSFNLLPGAAKDIAVGANGSAWAIGVSAVAGGYPIYRWNGTNNWVQEPGAAVDIAVGPDGSPWVVNAAHQIYHSNGSGARVSLSAVRASTGSSTTVTAYANADVGPTPYYIEIFDETGARLTSCGTGSSCSYTYTPSLNGNALVAFVSDSSASLPPGNIQATSNVLYVAHH